MADWEKAFRMAQRQRDEARSMADNLMVDVLLLQERIKELEAATAPAELPDIEPESAEAPADGPKRKATKAMGNPADL